MTLKIISIWIVLFGREFVVLVTVTVIGRWRWGAPGPGQLITRCQYANSTNGVVRRGHVTRWGNFSLAGSDALFTGRPMRTRRLLAPRLSQWRHYDEWVSRARTWYVVHRTWHGRNKPALCLSWARSLTEWINFQRKLIITGNQWYDWLNQSRCRSWNYNQNSSYGLIEWRKC